MDFEKSRSRVRAAYIVKLKGIANSVTKSGKYSESVLTYFIQTIILACRRFKCPFACGLYDRMNALYTGEVKLEGSTYFLAIHHPRDVFDRVVGGREFDAFELSASEYICRYATGDRQFENVAEK